MPASRKAKPNLHVATQPIAFRLRVELDQTTPLVWRRLEVLASSTFWDLHVAIQDAFGWLHYHLHQFDVGSLVIGVPDEDDDGDVVPGWIAPLSEHLGHRRTCAYLYDFGDDWRHTIHLEEIKAADAQPYPRCLAGENATPPEDCGGVYGYEELKEVLTKPRSRRYREIRDWLENGHAKVYWPFDPLAFDRAMVVFRDPAESLREMLEE